MLLLVFASIWIFKRFRLLAEAKGLDGKKWGRKGVLVYLGFALGGQVLGGLVIGLMNKLYLLDGMREYGFALICYGLGGLAAYFLYQELVKEDDHFQKGFDQFGKDDFES